jgi:hypothetical protein
MDGVMILLALDASTTAVGWALFLDGDYLSSSAFGLGRGVPWWKRVDKFGTWLNEYLRMHIVDRVAFELATGNKGNMRTNRVLGAVEYMARSLADAHDIPLTTVTASQVKASGVHKNALAVAEGIAGRVLAPGRLAGDEADAIGVGFAAWKKVQEAAWTQV